MLPFNDHFHVSQLCWPNHQGSWWLVSGSCLKKRIFLNRDNGFFHPCLNGFGGQSSSNELFVRLKRKTEQGHIILNLSVTSDSKSTG